MLEQMIQEELALRLPQNLNAYMIIFCFSVGLFTFKEDLKAYYAKLSNETYRSPAELEPYFKSTQNMPWTFIFRFI